MSSSQSSTNITPSLASELEVLDREFASIFGSDPEEDITTSSSEDEEMDLLEQELKQLSGLLENLTETQADAVDRQQELRALTRTLQESLELVRVAYLSEAPENAVSPLSEEQMQQLQALANEIRELLGQLSSKEST